MIYDAFSSSPFLEGGVRVYVFQAVPHINVVGVSTCCVHPGAAGTEIFRGLWGNQLFTPFLSLFFKVSIQHKISNEQNY